MPAHRLDAGAAAGGDPAAAAGLPHRPAARAQRRPAAQPGQDRHGRVTRRGGAAAGAPAIGIDLLEIERLERALARRPRLAERLFTDDERAYAAARRGPGSTWPRASAPRRRSRRRSAGGLELPRGRGASADGGAARGAAARAAAERAARARRRVACLADPHAHDAGAVAVADRACPDGSTGPARLARRRCPTPRAARDSTSGRSSERGIPGARPDGARRRRASPTARARARARRAGRGRLRQGQQRRRRPRGRAAAARARPRGRRARCSARADELRGDARTNSSGCRARRRGRSSRRALERRGRDRRRDPRHRLRGRAARAGARARSRRSTRPPPTARSWSPATCPAASTPPPARSPGGAVTRPRRRPSTPPSPGCGSRPARRTPARSRWSTSASRAERPCGPPSA